MAEYYAVITQEGYNLTATDINLPHQFSENIPIKIIKDKENFNDYELIPFFVHSNYNYVDVVASNEAFPMEYDPNTQIAILPYEAFKKRGYLFVSLALKETSGDKTIYTGTVMFNINQSLNGSNTIPSEIIWIDAITKYVDTYMNNQYKPTYDKLLKDSQDLQSDAEELHNTVTSQQQNINNTLQTTQGLQEDIEEINETTKQLQQTTTQLQNNVNLTVQKATQQQTQIDNSIDVMGDYEIVQEDPTQIRFKKGNGEFGDTVDLGDGLASKSMVNNGGQIFNGNEYHGESSDYGLEIVKVEGNYYQETTNGYQLFDASRVSSVTQGGATITNNGDGSFTISGSGNTTSVVATYYEETNFNNLIKIGNLSVKNIDNVQIYYYIQLIDADGSLVHQVVSNTTGTANITEDSLSRTVKIRLGFYGNNGVKIPNITIKPMVYQDGDGTWERFTGGEPAPNPNYPLEPKFFEPKKFVSVGKNLINQFNLQNYNPVDRGTYISYSITGLLPNREYTMSSNVPKTEVATLYFGGIITGINGVFLNEPKTFKPDNDGCIYFGIRTDDTSGYKLTDFENGTYYIMLNEGKTAQYYVPFKGQDTTLLNIELRSLPNGVCDTYENGVVTRRVGKVVFDGSSDGYSVKNYISPSSSTNNFGYYTFSINGIVNVGSIANIKSFLVNKLQKVITATVAEEMSCYQVNANIVVFTNEYITKEDFISYLKSNPITLYYQLDTPTTEYYSFPIIPSYFNYTNAWHDSEIEANDIQWKAKTYDPLEAQNDFIEEDYIKIIETDDMVSTSSNRGGVELLVMDGAYEQVTTNGYQLFDASKIATKSQGGATVTNNGDGSFTISGSGDLTNYFTSTYVVQREDALKLLKEGKIYSNGNGFVPMFYVAGLDSNEGILFSTNTRGSADITQEMLSNINRLSFYFYSATGTITPTTFYPTVWQDGDGTWEPFTGGEPAPNPDYPQDMKAVEVSEINSVCKNLFNPQDKLESQPDTSAQVNGNVITITGLWYVDWKFKVKPNTDYTISFDCEGTKLQLAVFDKTGNYNFKNNLISLNNMLVQGHNSNTFNTKDNDYIYVLLYSGAGYQGTTTYSNVMMNKGNLEQSYIPFSGYSTTPFPLTLRALPNGVKDTYENGVVTRRVGIMTFDGSSDENWALGTSGVNVINQRYYITLSLAKNNGNAICDKLPQVYAGNANNISSNDIQGMNLSNGNMIQIKINKSYASTVETFKTWLQSNPITVWYELATPTTEVLNTPFIETYYPWTNIWTDSEVDGRMKIGFKNRFGEFYTKKEVDELIKEAIAKIGTQMIK